MDDVTIRRAEVQDAERLNAALTRLSADLGDVHRTSDGDIRRAGFGPSPSFAALLAEAGDEVIGAVMFSPVFSTTRGRPGVFISDLWVAETSRAGGLGRRLLAETVIAGQTLWGAEYLKLSVYHANAQARRVYERLGFAPLGDETTMILAGDPFQVLKGPQ